MTHNAIFVRYTYVRAHIFLFRSFLFCVNIIHVFLYVCVKTVVVFKSNKDISSLYPRMQKNILKTTHVRAPNEQANVLGYVMRHSILPLTTVIMLIGGTLH